MADAQLQSLVDALVTSEDTLAEKSAMNDKAQSDAQAAIATAAGTLQDKNAAHDDLSAKIDALVSYVTTLKSA